MVKNFMMRIIVNPNHTKVTDMKMNQPQELENPEFLKKLRNLRNLKTSNNS